MEIKNEVAVAGITDAGLQLAKSIETLASILGAGRRR